MINSVYKLIQINEARFTMGMFIAIAGNIGAGKTTLTRMLGNHFGWNVYFENVNDNPYLEDFYADMKRWSFPIQIYFLSKRFQAHQRIQETGNSSIQDRTIYEDCAIFARALYEQADMSERDFENYRSLNFLMSQYLKAPDLLIYLKKSVPALITNIKKRQRDYEHNIPIDYLVRLNRYYDEWIESYTQGNVITIESDHLDFVGRPEDFQTIINRVSSSLPQLELFQNSNQLNPSEFQKDIFINSEQSKLQFTN